jgi:hypothetical protein
VTSCGAVSWVSAAIPASPQPRVTSIFFDLVGASLPRSPGPDRCTASPVDRFPREFPHLLTPWTWLGLTNSRCNRVTLAEGFAPKIHDTLRGPTMDDSFCHDFFAHPNPTVHRRYEALRAVFLDHRPLTEVAQRFGYRYGTLRNLVAQFRAQCRTGQIPPFSPLRLTDAPKEAHASSLPYNRTLRPRPIAINGFSHQAGVSKRAWPGSFCSSRSWPNSGSMTW